MSKNLKETRDKKFEKALLPHVPLEPPTFLDGVFALFGNTNDCNAGFDLNGLSPDELDADAIAYDWAIIGQDLFEVLNDRERRRRILTTSKAG
jgi:hypothetical protein